jgi:hypothetical protein
MSVLSQRIGYLFMPYGDGDREVDVGSLHGLVV